MKTLLTLFVLLFSSSVVAESLILYCADIQVGGFEADTQYDELNNYNSQRFTIEVDMNKKIITSDKLDITNPECQNFPPMGEFDGVINCIDGTYAIVLNVATFDYTRFSGFGFAVGKGDDIGVGYGTCEK